MAYNIVYKTSVQRDLKKLSPEQARHILDHIEKDLPLKAKFYPALKGPFTGLRKYRIGDFRIVYAIVGNDAIILRIGHRKDVYKKGI